MRCPFRRMPQNQTHCPSFRVTASRGQNWFWSSIMRTAVATPETAVYSLNVSRPIVSELSCPAGGRRRFVGGRRGRRVRVRHGKRIEWCPGRNEVRRTLVETSAVTGARCTQSPLGCRAGLLPKARKRVLIVGLGLNLEQAVLYPGADGPSVVIVVPGLGGRRVLFESCAPTNSSTRCGGGGWNAVAIPGDRERNRGYADLQGRATGRRTVAGGGECGGLWLLGQALRVQSMTRQSLNRRCTHLKTQVVESIGKRELPIIHGFASIGSGAACRDSGGAMHDV